MKIDKFYIKFIFKFWPNPSDGDITLSTILVSLLSRIFLKNGLVHPEELIEFNCQSTANEIG